MIEKLTNNTDETTMQSLLSSTSIFEVPYFQRPYKWPAEKLRKFEKDLCRLADHAEESEVHFLGAIIIQGQQSTPVVAKTYQIIDGQQRLTSVFIYLLAAVRSLIELGDDETARALFRTYLVVSQDTKGKSNLKIHPSGQDRADMNDIVNEVLNFKDFRTSMGAFTFKPLATSTSNRQQRITKNFSAAKKFFKDQSQQGNERVKLLYTSLLQNITIVQIDIKDALSGPKIFDSLNSAHQEMTVGELVKNDIFSRGQIAIDERVEELEKDVWRPFYDKFGSLNDGLFDDYFFPYGLFYDSNVKKSEVYPQLRAKWTKENLTPEVIIRDLSEIQNDFLDLSNGTNLCGHSEPIAQAIKNLCRLGIPITLYPFLIKISHALRHNKTTQQIAKLLFEYTESFLVRRGAFGLEPAGLHAAFKGLWDEMQKLDSENLPKSMLTCIRRRSTVKWPTEEEFIESLQTRSIYNSRVTPYILQEYNSSLGGDKVDGAAQIEHILPQNPNDEWWKVFTREEHARFVNTLGNLTLVTSKMNQEVSNSPFMKKKPVFESESKYKMTRDFAKEHTVWTPDLLEKRSKKLSTWAANRWHVG